MPEIIPQTAITVEQIVQDFGDYYLDAGQNEANLHQLPFTPFGTKNAFTLIPTNDTILREGNVELDEVLQQYQDEFTPKGGVTFEPVEIHLRQMKIDQAFNPTKLQRNWLGFLTSNNTDRTTWPFINWFVTKYLMGKALEDMEKKAVYGGVYEAPIEGEPGEAAKVMDGVEKIFNNLKLANKITPFTFGTPETDPADFVTQLEEMFVDEIPEEFRDLNMEINMNNTLKARFKRGMRAKYKTYYDPSDISNVSVADYENLTIVGRSSMKGKERIWATPKANALLGVKGFENSQSFQVEKQDRKVKIYTDWYTGLGFIQPKLIFTTDGEF